MNKNRVISGTKARAVIYSQWSACHGLSGDSEPGLIAKETVGLVRVHVAGGGQLNPGTKRVLREDTTS